MIWGDPSDYSSFLKGVKVARLIRRSEAFILSTASNGAVGQLQHSRGRGCSSTFYFFSSDLLEKIIKV